MADPRLTWLFGSDRDDVAVSEERVGSLRLRIQTPSDGAGSSVGAGAARPIVLAFHGGGWCWGSPEQSRWLTSNVAARAGAVVVAPAYRLAPEHPYPAAVEDCWTALEWAIEHAGHLGADPRRIAVMGDSAGGTLATVLALKARDVGGPELRGQALVYPLVDLGDGRGPGLSTIVRDYLGENPAAVHDAYVSPIRAASHTGLPPTLIVTAALDPLRPHAERYAAALRAAEVPVTVHKPWHATHSYLTLPGISPAARGGLGRVVAFLRSVLDGSG